jgi:hypothetical protein
MTTKNEDFPLCSARQSLVQYNKDGTKDRVQRCSEPKAEMMGLNVIPSDCEGCPVRREVTKAAFDRGSYQPPLVAEVATVQGCRKDAGELPAPWLPCQDRNLVNIGGCCGQTKEIRVCDSIDCFRLGSQVTHEMCRECPHRKG